MISYAAALALKRSPAGARPKRKINKIGYFDNAFSLCLYIARLRRCRFGCYSLLRRCRRGTSIGCKSGVYLRNLKIYVVKTPCLLQEDSSCGKICHFVAKFHPRKEYFVAPAPVTHP